MYLSQDNATKKNPCYRIYSSTSIFELDSEVVIVVIPDVIEWML